MKTKFYSWEDCPMWYRNFGPFTKSFFESGDRVILVMVLTHCSAKEARMELAQLVGSLFHKHPMDTAHGTLDQIPTHVFFWTEEK